VGAIIGWIYRNSLKRGARGGSWAWYVVALGAVVLRRDRERRSSAVINVPIKPGDRLEVSMEKLDVSHELDMVPVFSSTGVDAEVEGDLVCGVLANTGIPAVLSGSMFPNLGISVCVPRARLEEAQRLIAEAQAAGPEAAVDAERASEDER